MIRSHRPPQKLQVCFLRRPVSFPVITLNTGGDEVFPCILAKPGSGDDVIDGQGGIGTAAILTAMSIAAQDVLP